MSRTKQKLAERVLIELGRADGANPAESADDIALAKECYEDLHSTLEDVAFWEEDSIPNRVFVPMAQHVAYSLRHSFGKLDYAPIDDEGRTPIQQLKALASIAADTYPTEIEYF